MFMLLCWNRSVFNASDAVYSSTAISEDFGEPVEVDIEVKGLMLTSY